MDADMLELIAQVKDERYPQERLEFVGRKIGQFPCFHPGPDMKRQSPATTVKVAQVRQGVIVIY